MFTFSTHRRSNKRQQATRVAPVHGEVCEDRVMLSADVASIDGTGNNVDNPALGSTDVELLRLTTVEYGDGVSTPAGEDRPSAREVSNAVAAQTESITNDRYLTDYIWIWGQFLDHDIDLTENADPAEPFPIEVPAGDEFFDPFGTGEVTIDLNRSVYVDGEDSSDGLRQQINQITAFIDGSVVYGSDDDRAAALRTFEGGRLKTSEGDLLPFNETGLPNAGGPSDTLFLAGDVRANENAVLSSMHTIWVREHNRIADEIAADNPDLTDEAIFQRARAIVTAEIQAITYNEFLPALLGFGAIGEYEGYDPSVDPGISNIFSTAAYRLGHSLLSTELVRLDADGNVIEDGNLALQDAFFNPSAVTDDGIDALLRGAATQLAQELDTQVIDDVRNFLFGPPGAGGFDLASLNIQRGRDHGLPDYNQARIDLGLESVSSFSDITSDPELAAALEQVYGDVNSIDVWVGGLAEDHLPGSSVGELFTTILVDQFERLRDGDRFWYENVFDGRQLREIENTTLADVIERNSDVAGLQENVFYAPSVGYFDLSDSRARNVTLRATRSEIQVVDNRTRRVIESQPIDDMEQIMLVGSDNANERVVVTANVDSSVMPGGMVVFMGEGGRDTLVIRGARGDDTIVVDTNDITINDMMMQYAGAESLIVQAMRGDDQVEIVGSSAGNVQVFGGDGDDDLRGGRRRERIYGEAGDDLLMGGGGPDSMYGGDGNDRLFGQQGRDRLWGGRGRDILDGGASLDIVDGRRERPVRPATPPTAAAPSSMDELFADGIGRLLQSGV